MTADCPACPVERVRRATLAFRSRAIVDVPDWPERKAMVASREHLDDRATPESWACRAYGAKKATADVPVKRDRLACRATRVTLADRDCQAKTVVRVTLAWRVHQVFRAKKATSDHRACLVPLECVA